MNYDDWKLEPQPTNEFCECCGCELRRNEETVCKNCIAEKIADDNRD